MTSSTGRLTASVLTPGGVGAVAVVRLRGAGAFSVLRTVFEPQHGRFPDPWPADRLVYGCINDPGNGGETVDDGIVAVRSDADGEHTVDINIHAGPRVVQRILLLMQQAGARVITDRTSDDRVDFAANTEMLSLLGRAETRRAVRFVARQRRILPVALQEIAETLRQDPIAGREMLAALIKRSASARYLVEGATVVFLGPPNAGKSTLINRLFDASQSVVSDQAGTTRDWVEVRVAVDGIPMRVIDTAGVRSTDEPLERESIRRAIEQSSTADVQVVVLDGSTDFPASDIELLRRVATPSRSVVAVNKSDLPHAWNPSELLLESRCAVMTSGLAGRGMQELRTAILSVLSVPEDGAEPPVVVSRSQLERLSGLLSDVSADDMRSGLLREIEGPISGGMKGESRV